jgi:uncharacterized membrane protein YphA (DoxX/SURF4 family)
MGSNCKIANMCGRELFLRGARLAFGLWLFYVGAMKWISLEGGFLDGADSFVASIDATFRGTWVPRKMTLILAWVILVLEPLCGAWLVLAKNCRMSWLVTALLLFTLTFGQSILGNHDVVANNWQYFFLALGCAALTKQCDTACEAKCKK